MSGRLMCLDVGDVRIGVAFSDESRIIATPHSVYTRVGWGPDTKYLSRLMAENGASEIVCGLPLNMDGSEGFQAQKVRAFAKQLIKAGITVHFQDERLTTVSAHEVLIEGGMKREQRKGTVDKVAAAFILQSYLDENAGQTAK